MTSSKGTIIGIVIAVVFVVQIIATVMFMSGSIYGDEYMFIRITENLPDQSTSATWLTVDRPDLTHEVHSNEYMKLAYETPIWCHTLLGQYLMYPLFMVIDPTVTRVARSIVLVLTLITVFLIADVIRRKFNLALAGMSLLPFLFSRQLLGGGLFLTHDCFMWVFFAISLWLIFVKPNSKWVYLTMTAMLMSKEIGLILIPTLVLAHYSQGHSIKRSLTLLLPVLSIVGWLIYLGVATGDMLYYWNHWQALRSDEILRVSFLRHYLINWGGLFYLAFTLPGLIANIRNKQYWAFIVLYLATLCYGMGWGFVPYQIFSMLFSGMVMTVLSIRLLPLVKQSEQVRQNDKIQVPQVSR